MDTALAQRHTITRIRRATSALAIAGAGLTGLAAAPSASAAPAPSASVAPAPGTSAAGDSSARAAGFSSSHVRIENIIDRWAMNTGYDNGTTASGASVQLWSWAHRQPHDWNSQWSWQHVGNGYYQYRNRWSLKCLDVTSFSFGAQMIQSTCNIYDTGQHWDDVYEGTHNGRSSYSLRNKGVSQALGVTMAAAADHTGFGARVRVQVLAGFSSPQRYFFSYIF